MDIDLLSKMVRELILDNDRVVLPGLGAFVAEFVPSTFSDKGYTINPPYRRLYFRSKPDEGNELAEMYARGNKVDVQVAEKIINDFVADLKETLHLKKAVVFPGLGRLRATKENNIFFVADENLNIYPEGFGLEPISLKTHQETSEEVSAAVGDLKAILLEPDVPAAVPEIQIEPAIQAEPEIQTEPIIQIEPAAPIPVVPVPPVPASVPERKIEIEAISDTEVLPADDAVDAVLAERVEEALMKAVEKIQQDKDNQEKDRKEMEREREERYREEKYREERYREERYREERYREERYREERYREERYREEKERLEKERLERERAERERTERERAERERERVCVEMERQARLEREKREAIRLEMLLQDKDVPANVKKKSNGKRIFWRVLGITIAVALVLAAVLALVGRTYPEWIDRFLYTPEELKILNQIL